MGEHGAAGNTTERSLNVPQVIFVVTVAAPVEGTVLYDLLSLHPDAVRREPIWADHLLSNADHLFDYTSAVSADWARGWTSAPLLSSIGNGILSFLGSHAEGRRHVVTTIAGSRNLERVFELFPEARLLLAVRDGRSAVERSVSRDGDTYARATLTWARAASAVAALAADERCRVVRFESLANELEAELAEVLRFCGLDPDAFDFAEADPILQNAHTGESPSAAWPQERHRRFNLVAGETLAALGYRPVEAGGTGLPLSAKVTAGNALAGLLTREPFAAGTRRRRHAPGGAKSANRDGHAGSTARWLPHDVQGGFSNPRSRVKLKVAGATRSQRTLPNFLLIAAPQCGTSSFFSYLICHPGVLAPSVKEVRFFNENYDRGVDWYRTFFPLRASQRLARRRFGVEPAIGEASPSYLWHPQVPGRVKALDPEMRLLALLRDPVDRTYSEFRKRWRWNVGVPLEQALELEAERVKGEQERMTTEPEYFSVAYERYAYVGRSRYADHLERWLEEFPREQLLVVSSADLRRDPASVVADTARFLGLPDWRPAHDEYARRNSQSYGQMGPEARALLARHFVEPNRRLYELIGRDLGWTRPADVRTPA